MIFNIGADGPEMLQPWAERAVGIIEKPVRVLADILTTEVTLMFATSSRGFPPGRRGEKHLGKKESHP
jgi:hypothetical protein